MGSRKAKPRGARVFDVVISGGGLVGLTLGETLAVLGLEVAVIDAVEPKTQLDPVFDGRSTAIAYASQRLLEAVGFWKHVAAVAEPITDIRVSDAGSFLFVHFGPKDAGGKPMGFMVENRHLRHGLHRRRKELANLTFLAPRRVSAFVPKGAFGDVHLDDGGVLKTRLAVAAEGRNSRLRDQAGLTTTSWDYGQTAIVATFKHALAHGGIAHEKFFPDGPFALLPLRDNHCSLVWSATSDYAPVVMGLGKEAFEAELQDRIGGFLGAIDALPGRWSFPLSYQRVDRMCAERLVLIGDAAHAIHPIAGQGLNMGFRDVAALAEVLAKAKARGEDLGSDAVLESYARWRRTDNLTLGAVTDGLTRLFSNRNPALKGLRGAGLGLANRIPPLRKFFVRHARGTLGKLPRLLEGELPSA
jgi:2-octaprenyl-6-methoxyphenol hydroxylase